MTINHHHHPDNDYPSPTGDACGNYPPPYDPCAGNPQPSQRLLEHYGLVTGTGSRAAFARARGFFSSDLLLNDQTAAAMWGGKNFPSDTGEPLIWFTPEARGNGEFYSDETRRALRGEW